MTPPEFARALDGYAVKKVHAEEEIVSFARLVVMTLKDRGCVNAAAELEARLFVLDGIEEEAHRFTMEKMDADIALYMLRRLTAREK